MSRSSIFLVALVLAAISVAHSFVPKFGVPTSARASRPSSLLFAEDTTGADYTERGVSVDQDGKSNVWAIEPKMEVSNKSSEEKTASLLVAGGGLAALGALAAVVLVNLPDPNQF